MGAPPISPIAKIVSISARLSPADRTTRFRKGFRTNRTSRIAMNRAGERKPAVTPDDRITPAEKMPQP